ncbi:hypothetical protein Srot_2115 [Segniliparus rotundus DSM 44985]|uniref:Uncharacterized protein n=1 Tax=Segniliparus rotundus (strain ATCC BAA-972 / CDC 1076 / CIP 108378 / DSM 44985 / JCM 13578) TaxID=640132 RepID=D6Z9D9_SEGRD|nr:hypothetical protein [Segniliparus rotundus]ADG98569.1 hypothetical protein Srot_2115 [Segniliparus rotundus DSM 44985]
MRLSRKRERFADFCMFTAGTQAVIGVLTGLGWLKLDTLLKAVVVDGYLVASLVTVAVGGYLCKRALTRKHKQAERQADQWRSVPGRPGVLQREAVVEFHGLLSEETPRPQAP